MTSKRKKTVKKPLRRRIRRFLRRHIFNKRAAQGSVTIFLIIIMLPMLIFSCSVIDICKIFMARNSTDGALNIAMNSRLASYDDILKDMYGILASSADEDDLSEKLTEYYKLTLESSTGTTLDKDSEKYVENFFSNLFKTDMSALDGAVQGTNGLLNLFEDSGAEFSVTPIATSSVSNPDVMHKQIVEYMKYRGPVYLASGVLDKIMAFSDVSNQANAAKAQIDFDKQLEKTGDAFKEVYENLRDLMADGEKLEKQNKFSEFYKADSKIVPPEDFVKNTYLYSLPSAFICTFFGEAFVKNPGTLKYKKSAEDAFDEDFDSSDNISDAADNLKDILKEFNSIKDDAKEAQKIFSPSSRDAGLAFIKNNSDKASSDKILNLLKTFGALFENCSYCDKDLISLIEAYNDARSYSNYLDEELGKKQSDEKKKELNDKKDEVDSALDKAEPVIREIKSAAETISDFMESEYDHAVNNVESGEFARLASTYDIVKKQVERLDFLLNGGIDNVITELEEADRLGLKDKEAIGAINSTSEKSNMMEVYSSQAEMVNEALSNSSNGKDELKKMLEELRKVYKAVKEVIESIEFLCDTNCKNPVVQNSISTSSSFVGKDFNYYYLNDFNDSHTNKQVSEWYSYNNFYSHFYKNLFTQIDYYANNYFIYDYMDLASKSDECLYFTYDYKNGENIQTWNSKNEAIKNNDFYLLAEQNGRESDDEGKSEEEEKAKKEAGNVKKGIKDFGNSQTGEKEVSDYPTKEDSEESSDETEPYTFVPKAYPTYQAYVDDLKTAYSANDGNDRILNELNEQSFSTEVSGKSDLPSDLFKSEDGDLALGASNALGEVGGFFGRLLTATRDNFYIAEYLTENFPCATTLKGGDQNTAQMISGVNFYKDGKPNVVCAHSSLEYILYGDMNGDEGEAACSVVKAAAVLFGVRFALNLIYALTSADLAAQIEPIIAPLEAIPFAGPIARTVILIGLSLGESALDVGLLLMNQSVAIFKTPKTWVCSPRGFLNKVKDSVIDVLIDEAVDAVTNEMTKAEDALANALVEGTESIETEVNKYADELLNSMQEEIENNVFNPITNTIKYFIEEFDRTAVEPTVEKIGEKLRESINNAVENLGLNNVSPDDEFKNVEAKVFNEIISQIDSIAGTIHENFESFHDTAKTAILDNIDALDEAIKDKLKWLRDKIYNKFTSATEKLRTMIVNEINSTADELKKQTNKMGDKIKTNLKSKINAKIRGTEPASSKVNLKKDNGFVTSKEGAGQLTEKKGDDITDTTIKATYEDYMYVFTVLGLCINENDMLMRAAQLMNANVELQIAGEVRKDRPQNAYNSDTTYNLNKAYTLFKGEAGSKTRTMFFGTTWNKENQQWILPASNVYSYKATTYVGY